MIHDRLDLDRWVAEHPLAGLDPRADVSYGPPTVAYIHQIRDAAAAAGIDFGPAVPTDLCLWNWGDSPSREVTKVGGVPYWPAAEPWPVWRPTGEPFTFVAQFCFADSADLLPALPGDLLSVLAWGGGYGTIALRWFRLGDRLAPPRRLPAPGWRIAPCHATLHRTVDYLNARGEYGSAASKWLDRYGYPLGPEAAAFGGVTKIGGRWWFRGELPDPDDYDDPDLKAEFRRAHAAVARQTEQFVCQLLSIPAAGRHPFVNVARYDDLPGRQGRDLLMIGDVGGLDFFYDGADTFEEWHSG